MELNDLNTILLVDDDPITCYIQSKLIRDMGFTGTIDEVYHGKAALDYLSESCTPSKAGKNKPLLVLLDINMPFMDGFEFLEELRTTQGLDMSGVRIAILTTSFHKSDIERASNFELAGYMPKPLTEAKFNALIEPLAYTGLSQS